MGGSEITPGPLRLPVWQVAKPADHVAHLAEMRAGKRYARNLWVNDGSLSPLTFYCYLKARFGPPQGSAMLFRVPSTDNFIHWNYAIVSEQCYIDILGTSSRIEIRPYWDDVISPEAWLAFRNELDTDFRVKAGAIAAERRALEKWVLFINPYRRLDFIALQLERRLRTLDLAEPLPLPAPFGTQAQVEEYVRARQKYLDQLVEAQTAGLGLRMISPVLCEAFINLLIFLLANDVVKADRRLRESVLRSQVDVRAKSLSLNCIGFAKPVDGNAQEFKDFCRLMDGRNDLLHGNVDPESLMLEEVYFDQRFIPLFTRDESLLARFMKSACKHIEPEAALKDLAVARGFIGYLLDCLLPAVRPEIEGIMKNSYPGWRPDLKRAGILFAEDLFEFVPIVGGPSEKAEQH